MCRSIRDLDILQAGVIPPNPNELLMKPSLGDLFVEARKKYDIILVDSAPLGVVSDTLLIAKYVDNNLCNKRKCYA